MLAYAGLAGGLGLAAALEGPAVAAAVRGLPMELDHLRSVARGLKATKRIRKENLTFPGLFAETLKKYPNKVRP